MQDFNIEVISKNPEEIYGALGYWGKITIGDFTQEFVMYVDSWTLEDYKQQWKEGLERIKTHDSSCLVVEVTDLNNTNPKELPLMILWKLYKKDHTVFFTYQILSGKLFTDKNIEPGPWPYYLKTCYQFVAPRITNEHGNAINEEGSERMEWCIDLKDIEPFLNSLQKK